MRKMVNATSVAGGGTCGLQAATDVADITATMQAALDDFKAQVADSLDKSSTQMVKLAEAATEASNAAMGANKGVYPWPPLSTSRC